MASEALHKFVCLCRYLQDPCHVARFQQFCGVRGTFPKNTAESDAKLAVNGACVGQCQEDRAASGDSAHGLAGQRLRKSPAGNDEQNESPADFLNGPSGREADRDSKSRVKPLRRNSLTGEVGQEFIIENKFLFYLFSIGTELGNEMFFIVFFPFLMWNVDPYVSRQLIVVWAWVLFIGQSTKDLIRWTRPASPPVIKVEVFFNTEYSMPSTHAMTGTAMPFCLFMLTCSRWEDPCHVARFQQFCGVRGTFPKNTTESDAELAVNGACVGQCQEDRAASGDSAHGLAGQRLRKSPAGNDEQNESPADFLNGPSGREVERDSKSRVKPLRRNSLTGEVGQEFIIENKFLFYLFSIGTELGNEMFFIVFFPFLMWNVDPYVSRQLIVVWAWVLFIGQSTKDLIRWTRPASPPVIKVEVFFNTEYSMPSTHAMTGTAMPFCLFMLTCSRWEYPFMFGLSAALFWSILVCTSRIYLGMHSVLEVITGFLYSVLILVLFHPMLADIDMFYLSHSYAPLVIVIVHVGFSLVAFSLDSWSTSRGDTAQALATAAGAALACRLNHQLGLQPDPPKEALPLTMPLIDGALLTRSIMRLLVGVAVLLAVRAAMKVVAIPVACKIFGVPSDDVRKARQHAQVELVYRFIVYGTLAYCCAFLVPLLFSFLGLS